MKELFNKEDSHDDVEEIVEEVVEETPLIRNGTMRNNGQEFYDAKQGLWISVHTKGPVENQ